MSEPNAMYTFNNNNYSDMKDEELITLIKNGDGAAADYIIEKYKKLINLKVGKYFIIGAEKEDIIQEGMIGIFKAIKNFDASKENSFKSFANMCIERQLITAVKNSNRQKHMPLNSYLSLNGTAFSEDEDTEVLEVFNSKFIEDPLETITKKEYYASIENAIDKSLSPFEKQVLKKFINGESYISIAQKLDTPVKSVDNAIQRIRKKAIRDLAEKE